MPLLTPLPESFVALLIADEPVPIDAREAIAAAGGRIADTIAWDAVARDLDRHAGTPALVVEATGADEQMLALALPRLDATAKSLDLQVVVTLAPSQIDLVTAAMLGANVQLLCEPTLAQRTAALALAAHARGGVMSDVREGEAERLRRLNEEVARIAEVLVRLTAEDRPRGPSPGDIFDRRNSYDAGPDTDGAPLDPQPLRQAIRARRMRDGVFGEGLFEDPAWDMLLDLFAAELEGARVSVSSLCIAAAVAPTTALRWIGKLTEAGLFERRPDPVDRRRAFMALSEKGSTGMRGYVGALRRAGLAIP